ncbi:MAG TPA: hypothetical protein VF838_12705 [Trebonia sp.]
MTGRRVLVVDDEPRIRGFLSRALGSAGFTVTEAATGPQGLKSALTCRGSSAGSPKTAAARRPPPSPPTQSPSPPRCC